MFRWLCKLIFRITGWKADENLPNEIRKCVVIAAPHTSNWDFWYCMAAFSIYRLKIRFTVKKEWMRFPYNLLMGPLGGIGIDRSPKKEGDPRRSQTEAMTDLFKDHDELVLVMTPEGTRSKVTHWKTGFYHVAKEAGIPILLGYADYKKKVAGIGKVIYPTDMEKDMKEIMAFYKDVTGKFPEKFSLDVNYLPDGA